MSEDINTARLMGEIHSDVKHIVKALDSVQDDMKELENRLTVVERFNMRIAGMAALGIPLATLVMQVLVAKFLP